MKIKLMALILAAGLGITGVAGTALAAEASTTATCKHETIHYFEVFVKADFYNWQYHVTTYRTGYECIECGEQKFPGKETRYEPHDYEQIYYRDGTVRSTCLDCKDTF